MADFQINPGLTLRPKIAGYSDVRHTTIGEVEPVYLPTVSAAVLPFGTFVRLVSGNLVEATAASTTLYGVTNNTIGKTVAGTAIGYPYNEWQIGTDPLTAPLTETYPLTGSTEFEIACSGTLAATQIGGTFDLALTNDPTGVLSWYLNLGATSTNVLFVERLIDPVGTVNGRVWAKLATAARQAQ